MEYRPRSWMNHSCRRVHAPGLRPFRSAANGRVGSRSPLLSVALGAILVLTTAATPTTRGEKSLGLQPPKEEVEAPDFTLPDPAGKMSRLKDFRGKVVFLNFFATWCEPCRAEMPAMDRLHRTYKDKGLVVLAVDIRENAKDVQAFTQELKLSFPALLDEDGSVASMYGIRPVPATYLIGRDGKILWRAFGAREWDSSDTLKYFARILADGKQ
jgi:peroxiredoxin